MSVQRRKNLINMNESCQFTIIITTFTYIVIVVIAQCSNQITRGNTTLILYTIIIIQSKKCKNKHYTLLAPLKLWFRKNQEFMFHFNKTWSRKCFCKYINNLICSRNITNIQLVLVNLISNKKKIYFDVFCLHDMIHGKVLSTNVVTIHKFLSNGYTHLLQN